MEKSVFLHKSYFYVNVLSDENKSLMQIPNVNKTRRKTIWLDINAKENVLSISKLKCFLFLQSL